MRAAEIGCATQIVPVPLLLKEGRNGAPRLRTNCVLVRREKLWIVDRSVVVNVAPAISDAAKDSRCADLNVQPRSLSFVVAALSSHCIRDITRDMQREIVELKVIARPAEDAFVDGTNLRPATLDSARLLSQFAVNCCFHF
jgi:hypothetical protein